MSINIILIASILLSVSTCIQSARILGVFPLPGRSHYILGSALMRGLAEAGHDVTVISSSVEENPPAKYRDVLLTDIAEKLISKEGKHKVNMFEIGEMGPYVNIIFVPHFMSELSEWALNDTNVQKLIHSDEKFDAVIVEQFYNDALKALANHFSAVQIILSTMGPNFWINPLVANPSPLAYVPDLFLSYPAHMTFCERLTNTLVYILNVAVHHLYAYPKQKAVSQKYIPNAGNFEDTLYNASLILLNSHSSINQPVPFVPNMIEIGGFHVKPPKKLPEDLQSFLDSAKDGVIYFSMGSNLKSVDLPAEKRDAILKVFSSLKQKVLWKWEEDVLPGKPKNVKLSKWFPQQSILAHPNVKLFITHGGLLSTTETIYFGVPVLAIPIYGDQRLNAQNAEINQYGLTLAYKDLSEQTLREKITKILDDPKYSINVKSKSKIFHDREAKPMDKALYWVDYVIRHKGAPHLRVAGVDLPWYKYHALDVIAFLIVLNIAILAISLLALRVCLKKSAKKVKNN